METTLSKEELVAKLIEWRTNAREMRGWLDEAYRIARQGVLYTEAEGHIIDNLREIGKLLLAMEYGYTEDEDAEDESF